MKKIFALTALLFGLALAVSAQPRAFGLRLGSAVELSYQHYVTGTNFIEADLGMDILGNGGFKFTGVYNWEIAHPNWTTKGEWTWYAGPGIAVGMVYNNNDDDAKAGFMLGICGMTGLEYTFFQVPLSVSVDVRPQLGYHFGDGDFYGGGTFGLVPTVGLRYRF